MIDPETHLTIVSYLTLVFAGVIILGLLVGVFLNLIDLWRRIKRKGLR